MGMKILYGDVYDAFFRWLPLSEYIVCGWKPADSRFPRIFHGAVDVTSELAQQYFLEVGHGHYVEGTPSGVIRVTQWPGQPFKAMEYRDRQEAIDDVHAGLQGRAR